MKLSRMLALSVATILVLVLSCGSEEPSGDAAAGVAKVARNEFDDDEANYVYQYYSRLRMVYDSIGNATWSMYLHRSRRGYGTIDTFAIFEDEIEAREYYAQLANLWLLTRDEGSYYLIHISDSSQQIVDTVRICPGQPFYEWEWGTRMVIAPEQGLLALSNWGYYVTKNLETPLEIAPEASVWLYRLGEGCAIDTLAEWRDYCDPHFSDDRQQLLMTRAVRNRDGAARQTVAVYDFRSGTLSEPLPPTKDRWGARRWSADGNLYYLSRGPGRAVEDVWMYLPGRGEVNVTNLSPEDSLFGYAATATGVRFDYSDRPEGGIVTDSIEVDSLFVPRGWH